MVSFCRWMVLCTILLIGAGEGVFLFEEEKSPLYLFVEDAELLYENEAEKKKLKDFFQEMLSYSPPQIHARRYPDDKGTPNQWTAIQVMQRYIRPQNPERKVINEETFYDDLTDMEVKRVFAYWVINLDGNLKGKI